MLQVDVPKKLADAKVDDKDLFEVNHQILRLEVAMDDWFVVNSPNDLKELIRYHKNSFQTKLFQLFHISSQILGKILED